MLSRRNLVLAVAASMGLLLVATAIWPLMQLRDENLDRAIEADFQDIYQMIEDVYSDEGRLPSGFDELELSEAVQVRAEANAYAYEKTSARQFDLCAEFKTEKSEGEVTLSPDFSISDIATSSYLGPVGGGDAHSEGYDCIEYEVFGFSSEPFSNGFSEPLDFDSFFDSSESESFESLDL